MATNTPTRSCIAKKNEAFGVTNGKPGSELDIKVFRVANEKIRLKVKMLHQEHGLRNLDPAPYPGDGENPFWKVITGFTAPYPGEGEFPFWKVITGFVAVAGCITTVYVTYQVRSIMHETSEAVKSLSKAFIDVTNEGRPLMRIVKLEVGSVVLWDAKFDVKLLRRFWMSCARRSIELLMSVCEDNPFL